MSIETVTWNGTEASSNFTIIVNGTLSSGEDEVPQTRVVFDVVVLGCMLLIMFAMGCEVPVSEFAKHVKRPTGIAIGLVSQFLLLPLAGFTAVKVLGIEGLHAASILILACSPGGGYSNLLTYLCRGDVPLSVAMTTISNVVALGMTPLNMWVYTRGLVSQSITIPFLKMFISLISLAAILALGMATRWKMPRVAPYIVKAGVGSSALLAVACGVLAVFLFPDFFTAMPVSLYWAVLFVAPLGLTFAYCLAWAFREKPKVRRTVAIEAAVQNVGTAMTIAILSYPKKDLKVLSQYVILYAATTVMGLLIVAGIMALWRIFCSPSTNEDSLSKSSTEKPIKPNILVDTTTF